MVYQQLILAYSRLLSTEVLRIVFIFKKFSCRIILALDLELWYLLSLRYVSAIKLLGRKLYMIQNMV